VSATFRHFGALTSTHPTATSQPPLEERVWLYDVDTANGVVRYHARRCDHTVELPLEPMHGTIGVAPAAYEVRSTIVPEAHGGNLDTPEVRAGVTAYFGVTCPARCSPSVTGTPAKAVARSAGWPSRRP
jgi:amidase